MNMTSNIQINTSVNTFVNEHFKMKKRNEEEGTSLDV